MLPSTQDMGELRSKNLGELVEDFGRPASLPAGQEWPAVGRLLTRLSQAMRKVQGACKHFGGGGLGAPALGLLAWQGWGVGSCSAAQFLAPVAAAGGAASFRVHIVPSAAVMSQRSRMVLGAAGTIACRMTVLPVSGWVQLSHPPWLAMPVLMTKATQAPTMPRSAHQNMRSATVCLLACVQAVDTEVDVQELVDEGAVADADMRSSE